MYSSLREYCHSFHLYIFAFDDKCHEILSKLDLNNTTIISLKEFEDKELLEIKSSRSPKEYCWTCTPSVLIFSLEKFNIGSCTYLDADLFFFSSPEILLREMPENDSVMITEHRFKPDDSVSFFNLGIYCVQFMIFKNDHKSLEVLNWWRKACIAWCFARTEIDKFGDQKYLNNWPGQFSGIYILKNLGGGVGPWNQTQYNFYKKGKKVYCTEIKTGNGFKLVFYHFSGLNFFKDRKIKLSYINLRGAVKELIYKPYLTSLESARAEIAKTDNSFDPHGAL
jgi:hypothetical protein